MSAPPDPFALDIIDYADEHHDEFRQLYLEWVNTYHQPSADEMAVVDQPQQMVIAPGGAILMARQYNKTVGTVGLMKINDTTVELTKLAVTPSARGKHIGQLLEQAAIEKARAMGFHKLTLECDTKMTAALSLQTKLGFQKVDCACPSSPCQCNTRMELTL